MSSKKFRGRISTLDPGSYRGSYEFIAGDLSLDFVNTVSWRGTTRAHEWLSSYTNLIDWAFLAGIISHSRSGLLMKVAGKRPILANRVLARAIRLREALNGIVESLAASTLPTSRQIAVLNANLPIALQRLELLPSKKAFIWAWKADEPRLDEVLWPIVWSASNFLISQNRNQISACESCGWFFLDATKNHTRRWCTMADCGNRAKARRYRLRHR